MGIITKLVISFASPCSPATFGAIESGDARSRGTITVVRRRIFSLASALSLLLCDSTAVLGVLGPERTVVLFHFSYHQSRWQLVSKDGMLFVNNQPQPEWELVQLNALYH